MNKYMMLVISFFFSVMSFWGCTNNTEPENTESIGTWKFSLFPLMNVISDTMNLTLIINSDNTYSLDVVERSDKPLFTSHGTWQQQEDSVTLIGQECKILDTSGESDSLSLMDSDVCATPIVLSVPTSPDLWTIKTSSLEVPLSALPITDDQLTTVITLIQTIQLTRVASE